MFSTPAARRFCMIAVVALAVAALGFPGDAQLNLAVEPQDSGILTFSTVGDSRQDPVTPDPSQLPVSVQDATWLENTKAACRIFNSINEQRASMLFFNGDMVMGYGNAGLPGAAAQPGVPAPEGSAVPGSVSSIDAIVSSDLVQFYRQYAFWRGMVAPLMEKGTYVVPVPGNHETQWKAGGKKALTANENAWRANMGDLIFDDARFANILGQAPTNKNTNSPGAADLLTSNQSQLSFSFDVKGSHFVVINTDPVGKDAHAPTNWLAADLALAQGRGVKRFFVFGHKPAFTYYYSTTPPLPATPSGLDGDLTARNAFWAVIEQYNAIYFCGHEHIFNISQPLKATGGKAWQVIVGSGGSPFEAAPGITTINPNTDRAYAWATIKVFPNGLVHLTAYGFDDHYGNTRVLQTLVIH